MDVSSMFFQGWEGIFRTLLVGVIAYVGLVAFLRVSGKRTLAEGATALALLIFMQYLVTWVSVRWHGFARIVRSEATLLVRDGQFCDQAMRRERLTSAEILSAIRSNGGHTVDDAETVILENDGTVSVALKPA